MAKMSKLTKKTNKKNFFLFFSIFSIFFFFYRIFFEFLWFFTSAQSFLTILLGESSFKVRSTASSISDREREPTAVIPT